MTLAPPSSTLAITSGDFRVADKGFVDWFNATLAGRGDFQRHLEPAPFCDIFDHVADLWAPSLTLAQFVAFFCLMYNETGGTLRPIAEVGGPAYCFGTAGGKKASYNRHPNRLAGDQLLERGIIGADDVAAWNGTTWPAGAPADVLAAAEECDFYRFRGHGYLQTTWRTTYLAQVNPLLEAAGFASCDDLTTAELDASVLGTSSIALGMVRAFFLASPMPAAFAQVDHVPPVWAPTGTHVSGSAAYGTGIYTRRCHALHQALLGATFDSAATLDSGAPVVDTSGAGA